MDSSCVVMEAVEEISALRETVKEQEERLQEDCITINQLQTTIDVLVDRYAQLRRDMELI